MKKDLKIDIAIRWFLLIIFLTPLPCNGQDELLVDMYMVSTFQPEKFTDYVKINNPLYDEAFHRCLHTLRENNLSLAMKHIASCERMKSVDDLLYTKCINENPNAQMFLWLSDVQQVISSNKRWEDTQTGSSMIMGKNMMDTISPGYWVQLQRIALPLFKPYLSCE
jgi:hypothetical protein